MPAFDSDAIELVRPSRMAPEAVAQALMGLPAVLVWELDQVLR